MKSESSAYHEPVLLHESLGGLQIVPDGIYVDATFGGGGHSRAILEKLGEGKLFVFDQDEAARQNVPDDRRVIFINQNFRYLKKMLRVEGIRQVSGIMADLGVSSFQLNTSSRGFAHRLTGLLDMRMDQQGEKTAAGILNDYEAALLQKIFSEYGEVRNARTLAETIVAVRATAAFSSIESFIEAISSCIRGNRHRYLSQVFQALRIEVNDELNALREFLQQSAELLVAGGRLVVISYHSLEDRLVKNFMRSGNTEGLEVKDVFGHSENMFKVITRKPVEAGEEEVKRNPRARSAKLRVAEKTGGPHGKQP